MRGNHILHFVNSAAIDVARAEDILDMSEVTAPPPATSATLNHLPMALRSRTWKRFNLLVTRTGLIKLIGLKDVPRLIKKCRSISGMGLF